MVKQQPQLSPKKPVALMSRPTWRELPLGRKQDIGTLGAALSVCSRPGAEASQLAEVNGRRAGVKHEREQVRAANAARASRAIPA